MPQTLVEKLQILNNICEQLKKNTSPSCSSTPSTSTSTGPIPETKIKNLLKTAEELLLQLLKIDWSTLSYHDVDIHKVDEYVTNITSTLKEPMQRYSHSASSNDKAAGMITRLKLSLAIGYLAILKKEELVDTETKQIIAKKTLSLCQEIINSHSDKKNPATNQKAFNMITHLACFYPEIMDQKDLLSANTIIEYRYHDLYTPFLKLPSTEELFYLENSYGNIGSIIENLRGLASTFASEMRKYLLVLEITTITQPLDRLLSVHQEMNCLLNRIEENFELLSHALGNPNYNKELIEHSKFFNQPNDTPAKTTLGNLCEKFGMFKLESEDNLTRSADSTETGTILVRSIPEPTPPAASNDPRENEEDSCVLL